MLKTWGNAVGSLGNMQGISTCLYPHAYSRFIATVGKYSVSCTSNRGFLPWFTHTKNSLFQSVRQALFHRIHRTYNKPLLNKLNNCY